MDANVFPDKRVGNYFNEHFINYKFDMEKGEGPAFAKKYNVRNYPTYLFINSQGNIVHRVSGSRPVDQLIEEGKKAVSKK
jgi:thioredoxin-related protein